MIDCEHYQNGCNLALHGGKPLLGNCLACIAAGENNKDYADRLFAASRPSIRLGDAVAAIAQPIARVIDRVAGTSIQTCGSCQKRKQWLNDHSPSVGRN
jgi:hypothetical protein